MKSLCMCAAGVSLSACVTAGSGGPLNLDPSMPQEVRQAATCHLFNADAPRYLGAAQLSMHDHGEAAGFWGERLQQMEGNAAIRERILLSGRETMASDYAPAPRDLPGSAQPADADYQAVIRSCVQARDALEAAAALRQQAGSN
ncbi:MAG: hypothetical protein HLUCCA04_02485 [Oceanicaulis sp. HLUCCA04]|nr:MAG: hypothetical protein HLUCCA04_02485 [Oceanicaulis sp. HLUCCA04]